MLKLSFIVVVFSSVVLTGIRAGGQTKNQNPPVQAPSDVVHVDTKLVQTDVMVFDKQGKFVEGLQADQFELAIDGKARPIMFFEGVVAGSEAEDAKLRSAISGRPNLVAERRVTVSSNSRGRTILFFVDDLHITPKDFRLLIQNLSG